jgi:hypothetical protein
MHFLRKRTDKKIYIQKISCNPIIDLQQQKKDEVIDT